jgi:hypothetical protein
MVKDANGWIKFIIAVAMAALAFAATWGATRSQVAENTLHIHRNTKNIETLDDEVNGQHTDLAVLKVELSAANAKLDKLLERD